MKDGSYIVLDGAHRLTKAVKQGLSHVPAKVLTESDIKRLELPASYHW